MVRSVRAASAGSVSIGVIGLAAGADCSVSRVIFCWPGHDRGVFVPDALAGVASCGAMFGRFVGTIVSGVCQILALVLSFVHGVSFGRVMCLALGAGCCSSA